MYKCINGWTKETMKAAIMERMLDHRSREADADSKGVRRCLYRAPDGNRSIVERMLEHRSVEEDADNKGNRRDAAYMPEMDTPSTELREIFTCLSDSMPLAYEPLMLMQMRHDTCTHGDPRLVLCAWIDKNVEDA